MSKPESADSKEQEPGPEPAAPCIFKYDGSRVANPRPEFVTACDFRNPGFLGQAELLSLATMQEKFVQNASARLSTFLRMECTLRTAKFAPSTFGEFTKSINDPAYVTLFQAEPLRGVGILDLSVRLGLLIADRVLGGRGRAVEANRHLTEIELALVEDAVDLVLTEWARQWGSGMHGLHAHRIGHETNGRFLQTCRPDAAVMVGNMEVLLGENIEQMQIALPVSMIEPLLEGTRSETRHAEPRPAARKIEWRAPYDSILVPVTAEWDVREISVREVLDLQPGNVLEMPRELIAQTRVRFADGHEFEGTVGVEAGRVAVQLTKQNYLEQQI